MHDESTNMGKSDAPRDWMEILAAILLGVATIAAAYCGSQAARWGGVQIHGLTTANDRQFESMLRSTTAANHRLVDVAAFINLQEAVLRGDERMEAFIRSHARPEFRTALEAWYRAGGSNNLSSGMPFDRPEYRLKDAEVAEDLRKQALEAGNVANHANQQSDRFVMHSVRVTLALFFLSMTTQLRIRSVRRASLVLGALVLVATLVSIGYLPRPP